MSAPYLVALQGFSAFERSALASYFRLASNRSPSYEQVDSLADSQFVIADADHAGVVQAIVRADRVGETVFIGARAPDNATAWMMRPIDPLHVMRELDAMVSVKAFERASAVSLAPGAAVARAPVRPPPAGPRPTRRADDSSDAGPRGAAGLLRLAETPPLAGRDGRGAEALLVDDSEIALRFLETRLQRHGLHTQRAASSGRALEVLAQRNFDFVFLDVELGNASELDGLALCQHIKRQHHPVGGGPVPVVVMVSAHHAELDRVRGMLAGCDAYLAKPLDPIALGQLLAQHGVPVHPAAGASTGAMPAA
jgi:two-component system cell cycle response regulator